MGRLSRVHRLQVGVLARMSRSLLRTRRGDITGGAVVIHGITRYQHSGFPWDSLAMHVTEHGNARVN